MKKEPRSGTQIVERIGEYTCFVNQHTLFLFRLSFAAFLVVCCVQFERHGVYGIEVKWIQKLGIEAAF